MSPARRRVYVTVSVCLLFLPAPVLAAFPDLASGWGQVRFAGVPVVVVLPLVLLLVFMLLTWRSIPMADPDAPADPRQSRP